MLLCPISSPKMTRTVAEIEEHIDVEKGPGDRPVGAGIQFLLKVVEVEIVANRLGMGLRIAATLISKSATCFSPATSSAANP